jgi:hypothetical protein
MLPPPSARAVLSLVGCVIAMLGGVSRGQAPAAVGQPATWSSKGAADDAAPGPRVAIVSLSLDFFSYELGTQASRG